jgi:hypothetical protein
MLAVAAVVVRTPAAAGLAVLVVAELAQATETSEATAPLILAVAAVGNITLAAPAS